MRKTEVPHIPPNPFDGKQICTDPFGSYTGLTAEQEEKPVQDADDL